MNWLLIIAGGILGSSHCVGMCGGFAVTLGSGAPNAKAIVGRQLVYSLGRIFTYCVCGASAGYAGLRLTVALRPVGDVQAVLSVAVGLLLVALGLSAAGVFRAVATAFTRDSVNLRRAIAPATCLASTFFAAFLVRPRLFHLFVAGLLNGLLPCSLVYAFLALAASSGDVLTGAITMGLFGLGTVPALMLIACGGQILTLTVRRHVFRLAAWSLVLTGVLTLVRGLGFAHWPSWIDLPRCALCG